MYINIIQAVFVGDTYFPAYRLEEWSTIKEQTVETSGNGTAYTIKVRHLLKTNK
jgi:dihydrofolate reductase